MTVAKPHYLLICDGQLVASNGMQTEDRGRWRFVLENVATGEKTEASDIEPADHLDRSSLLAVMRGLEALEQPSRVTLITTSRYVARGLQYGLTEWREQDFCWEHFGAVQPIRNADLWKRVDVALRFHEIQCRWMAQEQPHTPLNTTHIETHEPKICVASVACDEEQALPQIAVAERRGTTCVAISQPQPVAERRNLEKKRRLYPCGPRLETDAMLHARTPEIEPQAPNVLPHPAMQSAPAQTIAQRKLSLPVRWVWGGILALDAFLVSFLRCLFLLDPLRDQFRPRKF